MTSRLTAVACYYPAHAGLSAADTGAADTTESPTTTPHTFPDLAASSPAACCQAVGKGPRRVEMNLKRDDDDESSSDDGDLNSVACVSPTTTAIMAREGSNSSVSGAGGAMATRENSAQYGQAALSFDCGRLNSMSLPAIGCLSPVGRRKGAAVAAAATAARLLADKSSATAFDDDDASVAAAAAAADVVVAIAKGGAHHRASSPAGTMAHALVDVPPAPRTQQHNIGAAHAWPTQHEVAPAAAAAAAAATAAVRLLRAVSFAELGDVHAQIVDQAILVNMRTAAPSPSLTYTSAQHQRGHSVVLATALTLSGRAFTVQRIMVGQLDRGFMHRLGCHALGRLLAFAAGDHVLMFGYPMECPRRAERQAPAMLGVWLPVEGLGVRLVDLQRMRVLFADAGILCATDANEQAALLAECDRRRQKHQHRGGGGGDSALALPPSYVSATSPPLWDISNGSAGLPESPLTLEAARSPPGRSELVLTQMPVILYSPPLMHPVFGGAPPRGYRPFVDTAHRRD